MIYLFASRKLSLIFFLFLPFIGYANFSEDTLYLTWQQAPDQTMTVQWLDSISEMTSQLYVKSSDENTWRTVDGIAFHFPHSTNYSMHSVELTGLKPNNRYQFKNSSQGQVFQFRTMPNRLTDPIHFVVGGDMYHDNIFFMEETGRQAAKTNPSFAVIGGDIAYSVKGTEPQNLSRWIDWVLSWHRTMITPDQCLIPVVAAVGNHDVTGQYNQTPAQAKIFSCLFPMPGSQMYNVLDFGSYLSLILLDSSHANPIPGTQTDWLKNALEHRKHVTHRFAAYHVPAFPCIRPFDNPYSALVRKFWVPIFEEEGLEMAFEHHDHAYKRTYPLIKQKAHPQGVIYLGDGAWGVKQPRHRTSLRKLSYLEKFASVRHFIKVTLYSESTQITALDYQGKIVDQFSHPLILPQRSQTRL